MAKGKYAGMAEDAEKNKSAEDISIRFVKLSEPGSKVVGKIVGVNPIRSIKNKGTYLQYLIDTDEGMIKVNFGAAYDREMGSILKIGGVYVFTFVGQKEIPNGNRINEIKTTAVSLTEADQSVAEYLAGAYPTVD